MAHHLPDASESLNHNLAKMNVKEKEFDILLGDLKTKYSTFLNQLEIENVNNDTFMLSDDLKLKLSEINDKDRQAENILEDILDVSNKLSSKKDVVDDMNDLELTNMKVNADELTKIRKNLRDKLDSIKRIEVSNDDSRLTMTSLLYQNILVISLLTTFSVLLVRNLKNR
tara:strand:+ start:77 stop:586 length:510 start_codon:yes stop_codon:yes gene_type:complete